MVRKRGKHKARKGERNPWELAQPFRFQTPGLYGMIPKTVKQAILASPALDPTNYHLRNVRLGLFPEPSTSPGLVVPQRDDQDK